MDAREVVDGGGVQRRTEDRVVLVARVYSHGTPWTVLPLQKPHVLLRRMDVAHGTLSPFYKLVPGSVEAEKDETWVEG